MPPTALPVAEVTVVDPDAEGLTPAAAPVSAPAPDVAADGGAVTVGRVPVGGGVEPPVRVAEVVPPVPVVPGAVLVAEEDEEDDPPPRPAPPDPHPSASLQHRTFNPVQQHAPSPYGSLISSVYPFGHAPAQNGAVPS
ncbi:hypothetical protein CPC08DRAFT_824255 [Agrocybe pediades]|nr:hypothetical protein CPC08DRAFT_824255 [Agrocybe pediades]